jgi:hypothetical protein
MSIYLTNEDCNRIVDIFVNSPRTVEEYGRNRDILYLNGIKGVFVARFMPEISGGGYIQLNADLKVLNQTPRILDGSVPIIQWLQNAIREFAPLPEKVELEKFLEKVNVKSNQVPPIPSNINKSTLAALLDKKLDEKSDLFRINQEFYSLWANILLYGGIISKDRLLKFQQRSEDLIINSVQVSLLIRSALETNDSASIWVNKLGGLDDGPKFIRHIEDYGNESLEEYSDDDITNAIKFLTKPIDSLENLENQEVNGKNCKPNCRLLTKTAVLSKSLAIRQTSILALSVYDHPDYLVVHERINTAFNNDFQGSFGESLERKAELLGTLADALPASTTQISKRPFVDQGAVWKWRVARRLKNESNNLYKLGLYSFIGSGLLMGIFQSLVSFIFPTLPNGWALSFILFLILGGVWGALTAIGMGFVRPFFLIPANDTFLSTDSTNSRLFNWKISCYVIFSGILFFNLISTFFFIAAAYSYGLSTVILLIVMGIIAGFGVALALCLESLSQRYSLFIGSFFGILICLCSILAIYTIIDNPKIVIMGSSSSEVILEKINELEYPVWLRENQIPYWISVGNAILIELSLFIGISYGNLKVSNSETKSNYLFGKRQ